jgi:hypothetical protein
MRIKVTGYIDTFNLDPEQVDEDHEMGLSEKGFDDLSSEFGMSLDDLEFKAVKD